MGNHHHQERQHQHPAMDSLANLLTKANHDLNMVQFKLEREFQQTYPDNANPMKLVNRVKKIQDDLTTLKEQCRELLVAKQDLIDKAQTTLVGNRNLLRRMQTSMGVPLASADEDTSFANFNQIVDEWTSQVRARTGFFANCSNWPMAKNAILLFNIIACYANAKPADDGDR